MIALNSLLLALDEPALQDPYQKETLKLMLNIISIIFVLECVVRIIVMGFYWGDKTYLKDPWNILDFMVVIMGWVSRFMDGSDVSAIKVIRILRPLRTINQIPNMSSLVSTILNSLPIMFDVMVLFMFMLIMI